MKELRRIYDVASESLGFRRLEQFIGRDVFQLKLMLHALDYYRPQASQVSLDAPDALMYDQEIVDAVNRFRSDQACQTTVPGYVDDRTIERLWSLLERKAGGRGAATVEGDRAGEALRRTGARGRP